MRLSFIGRANKSATLLDSALVECPRLQEECVRSPQARASSGSKHTPERWAADPSERETLVGHRKTDWDVVGG